MTNEITSQITGAAIGVHKTLVPGLLESIYEEALSHELELRSMKCEKQFAQTLSYLKATGLKTALLINFGEKRLVDGIKRISL